MWERHQCATLPECVQSSNIVGTGITWYISYMSGMFQAALKVDQHDSKLRLVAIEKQLAALQAKAKVGVVVVDTNSTTAKHLSLIHI